MVYVNRDNLTHIKWYILEVLFSGKYNKLFPRYGDGGVFGSGGLPGKKQDCASQHYPRNETCWWGGISFTSTAFVVVRVKI